VAQGEEGWFSRPVAEQVARWAGGERPAKLTEREVEVLRLLAKGWTNAQIAQALGVSRHTVGFHVGNLLEKLGMSNRTEAVVEGMQQGWLKGQPRMVTRYWDDLCTGKEDSLERSLVDLTGSYLVKDAGGRLVDLPLWRRRKCAMLEMVRGWPAWE
jgi:DNA-binding CsgD family transcriptional regulator